MHVSVVGLGFVGLTTAVCFASRGIRVTGVDTDKDKIATIAAGCPMFYEAGLTEHLKKALENENLILSTDIDAIIGSDITIIAVGTPSYMDGSVNLSYVENASESIGKAIRNKDRFHIIAVKSTVPPGTSGQIVAPAVEKSSGKKISRDFGICSNPEFLKEGHAVADMLGPDKIVIGTVDEKTRKMVLALYRKFYSPKKVPTVETNLETAELIKYANNSFLATKISFINTIANICQRIPGTDIEKVAYAIGLDKRIGPYFLRAGLGYGGSCFPKDVTAMINIAEENGYSPNLLKDTHTTNQHQPYKAIELLKTALPELDGKTIAILGLSFKPNTNDMREAVSIKIIRELKKLGATIKAYDPMAMKEAEKILGASVTFCKDMQDCLSNSNACIIATEWDEFKKLTPAIMKKQMKDSILIDGRRVTQPDMFLGKIQSYSAIGYGYRP